VEVIDILGDDDAFCVLPRTVTDAVACIDAFGGRGFGRAEIGAPSLAARARSCRYDEASLWVEKGLRQANSVVAARNAAMGYALAGRSDQAQKAIARLRQIDPTPLIALVGATVPRFVKPQNSAARGAACFRPDADRIDRLPSLPGRGRACPGHLDCRCSQP
jgi:hypothetical protein